jgi:hypothetical protein
MAIMFITHFLILHTVQNIGAELTRFADREFYQVSVVCKCMICIVKNDDCSG